MTGQGEWHGSGGGSNLPGNGRRQAAEPTVSNRMPPAEPPETLATAVTEP